MNKKISRILRLLFFLAIGAGILWWLYKDQDAGEILGILKQDVEYGWIVLSLVLGLLSHVSRTLRWQMLIEPISKKPGLVNTFLSVMTGYLANLAIPRMGEISRCAVLSRYEKISFSRLIGTVVTERLFDLVMLLIALGVLIALQYNLIVDFATNEMDLGRLGSLISPAFIGGFLIVATGLLIIFRGKIVRSRIFLRVQGLWRKFREGLLSYKKVKNKPLFFFHTTTIFVLYYFMIYVCFWGFPFTSHLGPIAGLAAFVLGSLGMVAPVQGGIGPFHFMVIFALKFYGVAGAQAAAFALLVHGSINAMIIVAGFFSLIALPLVNKKG